MKHKHKIDSATYLMNFLSKSYLRKFKESLEQRGLSKMMYFTMLYIKNNPNSTMNALAREFGVDKSYITRIVARLLELGMVSKEVSRQDSRMSEVRLTKDGEVCVDEIMNLFKESEQGIRSILGKEEYEQLLRLLLKLYAEEKMHYDCGGEKNAGHY